MDDEDDKELRASPAAARDDPAATPIIASAANTANLRDRPEWRDVPLPPPLPTDAAGGGRVIAIADPPGAAGRAARDARGLFRAAALDRGERSARVRDLCAALVRRLNPADYTAWAVRWECVVALAAAEREGGEEDDGGGASSVAQRRADRGLALLAEEDAFTRRVAREAGTKNYQLWNHRRKIALASFGLDPAMPVVVVDAAAAPAPSSSPPPLPALAAALARELSFADLALKGAQDDDQKNYHAWAHRQAALAACAGQMLRARMRVAVASSRGGGGAAAAAEEEPAPPENDAIDQAAVDAVVWRPELMYCEAALRDDVRNNSAWAQRAFALLRGRGGGGGGLGGGGGGGSDGSGGDTIFPSAALSLLLPADVVDREIDFVADALLRAPRNESAWSYLWGLVGGEAPPTPTPATTTTAAWPRKVHELCCGVLEDDPECALALDALAGFYAALARAAVARHGNGGAALAAARTAADSARDALRAAEVADPIRRNYWRWRGGEVRAIVDDYRKPVQQQ